MDRLDAARRPMERRGVTLVRAPGLEQGVLVDAEHALGSRLVLQQASEAAESGAVWRRQGSIGVRMRRV